MTKHTANRTLALLVAFSLPMLADKLELRWTELPHVVTGKRVWLKLNEGTRVSGTVRSVEPTGLQLEIEKTSDKKSFPKGAALIPRNSFKTIQVNKRTTHKGIIIGGAVGGGVAAAAGGTLAAIRKNEGGTGGDGIIAAATLGPIAIGLLAGWLADTAASHGGRHITIIPE